MSATTSREAERPPLDALAAAMLLASLGASIATVALPALAQTFSAPVASVQWVIVAYLMTETVTIVLAGRFGDLFGHGCVLIAGLGIFAFASVLCAAAPTLGTLIAARAVQGVGGAVLMALPISIVRSTVEQGRIGSAMGLLGTMSAVGTALGPSLGGIVIAGFGWRAAFVLLAGLGVVALCLALRAFFPTAPEGTCGMDRRMDWPGAALLAVTLAAFALASGGGKANVTWDAGWLLAVAILGLVLFIAVEARSASPLVPVSILRDRATGTSLATNLLVSAVMMSTLVVGPFFLVFRPRPERSAGRPRHGGRASDGRARRDSGRTCDRPLRLAARTGSRPDRDDGRPDLPGIPAEVLRRGRLRRGTDRPHAGLSAVPGREQHTRNANAADKQRGVLSGLLGLSRNLGFMTGASVMTTFFAVSVGTEEITEASARVVCEGFTATFSVAAGMTLLALVLTFVSRAEARR